MVTFLKIKLFWYWFNQPMIKILFCFSYQGNLNGDWVLDEHKRILLSAILKKKLSFKRCMLSFHDCKIDSNTSTY